MIYSREYSIHNLWRDLTNRLFINSLDLIELEMRATKSFWTETVHNWRCLGELFFFFFEVVTKILMAMEYARSIWPWSNQSGSLLSYSQQIPSGDHDKKTQSTPFLYLHLFSKAKWNLRILQTIHLSITINRQSETYLPARLRIKKGKACPVETEELHFGFQFLS